MALKLPSLNTRMPRPRCPKRPKTCAHGGCFFHQRFSDDDIKKSVKAQPEKKYLAAYVKTL